MEFEKKTDNQKHLFVECIAPQKGVDSSRVLLLKGVTMVQIRSENDKTVA